MLFALYFVASYAAHAARSEDLSAPLRSLKLGSLFSFPAQGVASLKGIEGEATAEIFTTHLTFQFENEVQKTISFKKILDPTVPMRELTYGEMLALAEALFSPINTDFEPIAEKNGIFDLAPDLILHHLALELRAPITLTRKDGFLSLALGVCTLFERAPSKVTSKTINAPAVLFTGIDLYYLKTANIQTQPVLTLYQDESTNLGMRCQPEIGWGFFETLENLIDQTQSSAPVEWSLGRKHAES